MKNNKNIEDQEKELFSQLKPSYSKSKEDVWASLEKTITEDQTVQKTKTIRFVWLKYSAAASILIAIGLGLFARLYTTTVDVPAEQNSQHTLPDGSIVFLNAESSINYHPYWWSFNREVELNGEAFFEVEKGETFSVLSSMGSVEVLGTSFNIYNRDQTYTVYCKTGKVRVQNQQANEVILKPGQVTNAESLARQTTEDLNSEQIMSWRLNKFLYNTTPLTKVLEDFERHYGIKIDIHMNHINELHYTGLRKDKRKHLSCKAIIWQ
ncbi:MAG: FecR family protein [Flavobacteriales bacterium]